MSATVIETIAALRAALTSERSAGRTIALVATMGALHAGHCALIARAQAEADVVVVSIFVNPTQFNDAGDLAAYPRTTDSDIAVATEAAGGGEIIFLPSTDELYPPGYATEVRVNGALTATLEGAYRGAAHFHGVTTIVTKLLTIVAPDVAVFGAKDAQQLRVISRLVDDLNLQVKIVACETVRAADGLAHSSRNARLDGPARRQAAGLYRALAAAQAKRLQSTDDDAIAANVLLSAARERLAAEQIEPEYLALVDPGSFAPLAALTANTDGLLLIAATIGGVRLIDNLLLTADKPDSERHS